MERDEGGRHAAISYQRPEKADPLGQNESKGLPGGGKACLLKGTAGAKALRLEEICCCGRMESAVGGQEGEGCMMRLGRWLGPPDPPQAQRRTPS